MPADLQGLGILVTRPSGQAEDLCRLIEQANGKVFCFPVLEIVAPRNPQQVDALLNRLAEFHMAVFISANAVTRGMDLVRAKFGQLPPHMLVATVGARSAQTLRNYGVQSPICPREIFNSESLLALEPMQQVRHKKIIIFRGEGGREVLANGLRERGALVEYAQVYRRVKPDTRPDAILKILQRGEIHAVVVTSNEGLGNLHSMLGEAGHAALCRVPLLVVSERAHVLAKALGVPKIYLAKNASDAGIMQSLLVLRTGSTPMSSPSLKGENSE